MLSFFNQIFKKAGFASQESGAGQRAFHADALRETTMEALRDTTGENAFNVQRTFNMFAKEIDKAYVELTDALSKSASFGQSHVSVKFRAYGDDELAEGIIVEELADNHTSLDIVIWNFREPKGARRLKNGMAFLDDSEAKMFMFELMDFYRSRLEAAGFHVTLDKTMMLSEDDILNVSWMDEREYGQARQAMGMPGGYEAYKSGVSLEDIVA